MRLIFFSLILPCLFLSACKTLKEPGTASTGMHLKLIGKYELPHNLQFKNTTIGGLSGIDHDAKKDIYYLVSDDRSAINPARFYTARIIFNERGIDTVQFLTVNYMLQKDGKVYPGSKQDATHTPDPEAMRFDPKTNSLLWSSEGERLIRKDTVILEDPTLIRINREGELLDSLSLPPNMHMTREEKGPRQNGVFEGLSFADNYKKLFVSVEEPLYEDGPRAGLYDSTGLIRIIQYDLKQKRPVKQYAYRIEPVAYPALPAGAFKINGVPDILYAGKDKLLVIERSFSTGRKPCSIKVFLADLSKATDIQAVNSLIARDDWKPAAKTLLLDMDSLGIYTDNIEGVCFGPRLPNGHQTLIFVADDNFSADEVTQFFVFELE
jgi:hypothetical protein